MNPRAHRRATASTRPLRRAAEPPREWVGGRLLLPSYVMEGEPYRPHLHAWLELPDDLVVGFEVIDPKEPVGFAQTLASTLSRPLVGARRRPERIRVADESLATEIRTVAADIEIVVAPTPELDGLLDSMMSQRSRGDGPGPSYLEGGRVSEDAVRRLFEAAHILWKLAPWKTASDSQPLRVDVPAYGVHAACLSIIGALGQSLGFMLFPSLEAYGDFCETAERAQRGGRARSFFRDPHATLLSLDFERGADLPPSMLREAVTNKWRVASPDAYPRVMHRDADGCPRPLSDRDVLAVSAVATSLSALVAKHPRLFEEVLDEPLCESWQDQDDLEVRFTAPYDAWPLFEVNRGQPGGTGPAPAGPVTASRNGPCPCGSGKKYKKCCLGKQASEPRESLGDVPSAAAKLRALDERAVYRLMRYAARRFGDAWRRLAEADFTDAMETVQLFAPWSVYVVHVEGRSVLEWFLEEQGGSLSDPDHRWLEAQREAWLGIWEVAGVQSGEGLTVRDLLSGEERFVHEVSGSKMLVKRDAVLARVVAQDGAAIFAGAHPQRLLPGDAAEVVRRARAKLRRRGLMPAERLRDEKVGRHLISSWERVAYEADVRARRRPILCNTDGDRLRFTLDRFSFDAAHRADVEARICAMEDVEAERETAGERVFAFHRTDDRASDTTRTTIVGLAFVSARDLVLETNSIRRANRLRKRVEAACGELLRHGSRERAETLRPPRPGGLHAQGAPIPPHEAARIMRQFKERHYAHWVDEEIPALGGMTPRQASRTRAGRERVDVLLKQMESMEARSAGDAEFDFSGIRSELGLTV